MTFIANIVSYLIDTLAGLYGLVVLLRFVFQWVKADFYNPLSQGIVKLTTPILKPLRKAVPGLYGLDMAAIVLFLAIMLANIVLRSLLSGFNPLDNLAFIGVYLFLKLAAGLMNIFVFAVVVDIVVSFVSPMSSHPAALLSRQVAEPVLGPFRRLLPPLGGVIDISPIFVFLICRILIEVLANIGQVVQIPVDALGPFILI